MALTLVQQPGQILQVGQTVTTAYQQVVDSTPADTALTRAITPKFSTSKVMVNIAACFTVSNVDAAESTVLLKRTVGGSTTTLINGERFVFMDGDGSGNNHVGWPSSMMYLDSPNTTSEVTYMIQVGFKSGQSGTFRINDFHSTSSASTSTITLMEIAQ